MDETRQAARSAGSDGLEEQAYGIEGDEESQTGGDGFNEASPVTSHPYGYSPTLQDESWTTSPPTRPDIQAASSTASPTVHQIARSESTIALVTSQRSGPHLENQRDSVSSSHRSPFAPTYPNADLRSLNERTYPSPLFAASSPPDLTGRLSAQEACLLRHFVRHLAPSVRGRPS